MEFKKFIILWFLMEIQRLNGTVNSQQLKQNIRIKRGFNKYPKNNYESTIQVNSGILQYEKATKDSAVVLQKPEDLVSQHEISVNKGWQPSSHVQSNDHIIWSQPYLGDHSNDNDFDKIYVPTISQSFASLDNGHHHAGSVFSSDLSGGNILKRSRLHTNVLSDSGESKSIHHLKINDNIDFNNAFHKYYKKNSYGK